MLMLIALEYYLKCRRWNVMFTSWLTSKYLLVFLVLLRLRLVTGSLRLFSLPGERGLEDLVDITTYY